MARATKLKVYRTAAGFADAYVAAPSQKAALAAWGSDKDLFARGVAEIVTDETLTAEPLASPGKVIRRSRGSAEEQMAALPKDPPRAPRPPAATAPPPADAAPKRPAKPKPRPDRTDLDDAEAALERAEADARAVKDDFTARGAALARERREAERAQQERVHAATAERDERRTRYDAAMKRWRDTAD